MNGGGMDITFLSVEEVIELHRRQIEAFGGSAELRDRALLESAVAMPMTGFSGEFSHEFPHGMAAAYLFHLAANHPFVDGNKRVALAAALTFLEMNGFRLLSEKPETAAFVLAVAAGQVEKMEVLEFFKKHVGPA